MNLSYVNLTLRLLSMLLVGVLAKTSAFADTEWRTYGLDYNETRHSKLNQINASSVADLQLAWSYDVPDAVSLNSTPLMIDGTLYFSADRAIVHAIDARTGQWNWTYDPKSWRHSPRRSLCTAPRNRLPSVVRWPRQGVRTTTATTTAMTTVMVTTTMAVVAAACGGVRGWRCTASR